MISLRLFKNMSAADKNECNNLIYNNFGNNILYDNVLVYIKNNKIIAVIVINNNDNTLNQICTNIEYRRRGIATELIESAKKLLKKPIYLNIEKHLNYNYLIDFFMKRGFKIESGTTEKFIMKYN